MTTRNGSQSTALEELDAADLAGILKLALRDAREDLAHAVERADTLRELHARALVVATAMEDREPVTADAMRAHALADGGEEELARLEAAFTRL